MMREERKVITVVSTDLVGSTRLGERLSPEEVKLIVGEVMASSVRTIEELGGTVKDLAGDGVLALFGAPVAHEDDAERAVRSGLRIAHQVRGYGREVAQAWGVEDLAVRVGVHTGPVVLGPVGAGGRVEYAAFGDTVNTAARLQAAAPPGTVLVSEDTRRLIEPLFKWSDPQRFTVKGKSEALTAYEAVGERPHAGKPRGITGRQVRVVGRESELRKAVEIVHGVLAGSGGVLLITGEAGIGKSRLLLELRDLFLRSHSEYGRPLWFEGRCVSYGESLPYWPYRDLLREWIGVGADEPELRARVALRRHVERLFPDRPMEMYPYLGAVLDLALEGDATARLAQLSPEALQYRTFEVIGAWLERLARDGPVVMAIEDLHWADTTSVQLTERLVPLTDRAGVLIAITERPERDHPSWRVKEAAAREFPHRTHEIALEPLTGNAERELLASLVDVGTLPGHLEQHLLARAEGNPFFLEEMVRALVDAGALVRNGDRWRFDHEAPIEIPRTVEGVILARIDRLTPACREILTAAAVLGRRFSRGWLEGIAANAEPSMEEALHELQRLDLLRESRRWPQAEYRFKHALIQEAAYRTLVAEQRRRLHRRAAEWLESRPGGHPQEALGVLAHHWLEAHDDPRAMAYLAQAGDKARQEYALDEAIGHYRALLPLLERRGGRQEIALVLFKLALALHTSLRFAEANTAYQRAFEHWQEPIRPATSPSATLRVAMRALPTILDPKSAIIWSTDIRMCMQLFDRLVEAWPERTIVPSLAERWEISDDGLRYLFHLRPGILWSDGTPLTAHDVEYGIKRVLDPQSPGASAAIYFVLENGHDYCLGRNSDAGRIGVKALDDLTVEFRLEAPAPYFLSVMNRPDAGPQPRHAIERDGDRWTLPDRQVVSGPFRQAERSNDKLVLVRQDRYAGPRPGNIARVEFVQMPVQSALQPFRQDALDMILTNSELIERGNAVTSEEVRLGAVAFTLYIVFDHTTLPTASLEFRRALAHAIDRELLRAAAPAHLVAATGGLVPPALQGHTPEIAPRFDPEQARDLMARAEGPRLAQIEVLASDIWVPLLAPIVTTWERALGIRVDVGELTPDRSRRLYTEKKWPPIVLTAWLPGYPDPEYYLRLLLHSDSKTNAGGFAYPQFDALIERARQERSDRARLELFHEADRMAVADRVAVIPLFYGQSLAFLKPRVEGWWEFGKSCPSFADLVKRGGSD